MDSTISATLTFQAAKTQPFAAKYRSSIWFVLASVIMANFTDLFIYSIIVPVAPFALPTRAGVATEDVQYWISIMLAVFNVFSICASLPSGWITDKLRARRPMFIVGTLIQFTGLALLMVGNSIALWLAGRALQGVACAIVLTTTLPLLLEAAPKDQTARYLGLYGMGSSAALISGPLIGGVVYDRCGYYAVFAICIALNVLDFTMRLLIIEKGATVHIEVEGVDTERGSIYSTRTLVENKSPTQQIVELSDSSSDSESTFTKPRETKLSSLRSSSVVLEMLCSSKMLAALYGAFLYTTIQCAFDATLPLFVEDTFGWDSLGAGLIFIPLLMSDFCGPIFGWLADKFSARLTCTLGILIGIAPLVCLRFVEHDTIQHKVLLCALIATSGLGMAAVLPAVMAVIGNVIDEKGLTGFKGSEEAGATARAYGLFNIAYSGGSLIGPLMGGLIRDSAGWATMGWSLSIIWASGLVPVLLWLA